MDIGKYNTLKVARETSVGLYLENEQGEDVLLPKKYIPGGTGIGDDLKVFVYLDAGERPVATTLEPKATVGDFAALQVKQVSQHGAFLDWGLEKDLFVPFAEQKKPMREHQRYVVYIYLDELTTRIVASSRIERYVQKVPADLKVDQEVDLLVAEKTSLGYQVIINNRYLGLLYDNEVFKKLKTGSRESGFIKKVREDHKIDVSLQKQGYASTEPNAAVIMQKLRENNGFLPLNDYSDPQEISYRLEMSKKAFKRAIGGLYKEGLITIGDDGIHVN